MLLSPYGLGVARTALPRIALAQINATVGDLEGNRDRIIEYGRRAISAEADVVAFPEMVMTGYPPLDLLPPRETRPPSGNRKPKQEDFVRLNKEYLRDVAEQLIGITAVVGFVDYDAYHLYNAAAVLWNGSIQHVAHKTLLPTYDVFDEHRYFTPAVRNDPFHVPVGGEQLTLGASIC
jgi:NAD+ synthase (glutamine-hydrolysing)